MDAAYHSGRQAVHPQEKISQNDQNVRGIHLPHENSDGFADYPHFAESLGEILEPFQTEFRADDLVQQRLVVEFR